MKHVFLTTIASILALLALVGCGAGAPITPTPGPTSTPTPSPTPPAVDAPEWLLQLIQQFQDDDVASPPISVLQYVYQGETVYFVPQRCCDIFSDLYNEAGELIAHPDGGIAGFGDGRAPDFFENAEVIRTVWTDPRGTEARENVEAPIESVQIIVSDGRYALRVKSGLPDACHMLAGWQVDDSRFSAEHRLTVTVYNSYPAAGDIFCAQVYSSVETIIPLPYTFTNGQMYTVKVNDVTTEFTGGEHEARQTALDQARTLWTAAGLTDYTANFHWVCFCLVEYVAPVVLTVENGELTGVIFAEGSDFSGPSEIERYETVEGLFDLLQDAIDQGAYQINVEYHPELGYPTNVDIDYNMMMADEERGFSLEVATSAQ